MDARLELLKKQLASKSKEGQDGNAQDQNNNTGGDNNQASGQSQEGQQAQNAQQAAEGKQNNSGQAQEGKENEGGQQGQSGQQAGQDAQDPPAAQEKVLKDEDILKMISEKTGREVNAWDDLKAKEKEEFKFASEEAAEINTFIEKTGRGLSDYLSLKQDRSNDSNEKKVMDYWKLKYPGLSTEDLEFKMNRTFNINSEDEDDKRAGAIELKSVAAEADRYFEAERAKLNEPSKEVQEKRAKAQQEADLLKRQQEAFHSGMERSLENIKEVQLGEHVHKFDIDKYKDKMGSLDSILSMFNDENGNFQFDEFAKAIVIGKERDSVVKAIQDTATTKAMEESMKNHNNHGGTASGYSRSASNVEPSDGQKRTEQQIRSRFKIK